MRALKPSFQQPPCPLPDLDGMMCDGTGACRADGTGQTALHWAAVRGSLLAAEALLGNEADLRLRDGRGYTACHVAAQYGQTAFIYMVALRWRADVDRCTSSPKKIWYAFACLSVKYKISAQHSGCTSSYLKHQLTARAA